MKQAAGNRRAFTLVELLVVVAIIGILIALLLPAVNAAREMSRRMGCQNNLKQLALGLQNYHETWKTFPPSSTWRAGVDVEQPNNPQLDGNWVTVLLPFLEQDATFRLFDLNLPITHDRNRTARGTVLPVMLCPTDSYNAVPFDGTANGLGDNWARGNYGANASLGYLSTSISIVDGGIGNAAFATSKGWGHPKIRGVMGANAAVGHAGIRDGASNTILLGELRAGLIDIDSRGTWAMSGGSSALWCHGFFGDDNGPNYNYEWADDTNGCAQIQLALGGEQALVKLGMPCAGDVPMPSWQQTARSLHPGGVNVALCDGSVRWISDFIEANGTIDRLSIWDRLNASSDGQPATIDGN